MRIALIVLLSLWQVSASLAQDAPLLPGARVRVTSAKPPGEARVGMYQGLQGGLLELEANSTRFSYPLNEITRLELSRGHKPSIVGGVVGFVLGAGMGGFGLGCLANRDDYGVVCAGQNDTKFWVGAVGGGVLGGLLGAWLFREDRWVPIDLARLGR